MQRVRIEQKWIQKLHLGMQASLSRYEKIPAMLKIEYKLKLQSSLYRFLSRIGDDLNEATTDVVSEAQRNAWMDWK